MFLNLRDIGTSWCVCKGACRIDIAKKKAEDPRFDQMFMSVNQNPRLNTLELRRQLSTELDKIAQAWSLRRGRVCSRDVQGCFIT